MRKLLLDLPATTPALGFPATAEALARIIDQSAPQFSVGVFGGWGSGKTTLMQAIERELDPSRSLAVRFSAWRYEKERHLIVPLLDTVRDALVTSRSGGAAQKARARKTAATIGRVIRSIIAGTSMDVGVPGAIKVSFDANKALSVHRGSDDDADVPGSFYHASFRALQNAFQELVGSATDPKLRIVVFVDDLDRCLPENALQVLESMKLFFDLPGFVFVVGLDREVVEHAIDVRYARPADAAGTSRNEHISGAEYIKKIFQLPYRVAPVARDDLLRFVEAAWTEGGLDAQQQTELEDVVIPHLRWLVGESSVNPREIKRYINAYIMLVEIEKGLNPAAVLTLQTIAFRDEWRQADNALLTYEDVFADALQRRVGGEVDALTDLDPELGRLPDDLLEYVAPGQPGHVLFEVGPLRPYLSSGEATRSTQDAGLLDGVRAAGSVRRLLGQGAAEADRLPAVMSDVQRGLSLIEASLLGRSGPLAEAALGDVMALREALDGPPLEPGLSDDPSGGPRRVLDTQLKRLSDGLARRVVRLYRQGDVAAAPLPPGKSARR
jgi:hypothetical protein